MAVMSNIPEKDWKKIRSMQNGALELACQRILDSLSETISSEDKCAHERYLELWKIIKVEDKKIANMFDNLRRSTAILQLAQWKTNDLITDQDLDSISPETKKKIDILVESHQ